MLTWHACSGAVRAGNGDDTVSWLGVAPPRCASSDRMRAYGNDGDDYLRGGKYDDVLVGGPGQDTANGQAGYDVCRAEVTVKCEPS
jgi:D-alanyl-D-alanine carboxypeptidase